MKILWKMGKEALRYQMLYLVAVLSIFALTVVNLACPRILSAMTAVVEKGMSKGDIVVIIRLTIWLTGLYLLRVLFRYLSSFLAHKAAWYLVGDLRTRMYDKIQHFHMGFFHDKQTGDLMSRVVNDTRDFELLYAHMIPEVVTNVVTVIGVFIILLGINWRLAVLTCIPIPFILVSGIVFARKVRPNFRVSQKVMGQLNAKLQDNFSGVHEIQAFVQEEYEKEQVDRKNFEHIGAMLRALNLSALFHPAVEFLSAVGTVIVVGCGGIMAFYGDLSVADIVAFLLYLSLFYTPVSGLARIVEETQQALAGAERVMMILDTPVEVTDKPGAKDICGTKGAISFEDVSFCYENGVSVLDHISFSCEPGQMVALVGPTGVGKTTLTQLLSRFYEPTEGRITLDGVDINDYTLKSLRGNLASVLQDTFLFNGTIAENISYARPEAGMEEIIDAAKAAHIHDNIMDMPKRYETVVGERGMRLSGGQKQRIAIARAILRRASVIILDEATASIDVETEKDIQKAISDLAGTRTIVAIAHRLSTIYHADLILVLEKGRIVERGTHEELMSKEGLYCRMNQAQSIKI